MNKLIPLFILVVISGFAYAVTSDNREEARINVVAKDKAVKRKYFRVQKVRKQIYLRTVTATVTPGKISSTATVTATVTRTPEPKIREVIR